MKKLISRYLKPFGLLILICFGLLGIQAYTELNLPNYMSDIVNTGIQQAGVENATPDAITKDGLSFMTSFMTKEDMKKVNDSYELVNGNSKDDSGKPYYEKYSKTKNIDFYILKKNISSDQILDLDTIFGKSIWTFIYMTPDLKNILMEPNNYSVKISPQAIGKLSQINTSKNQVSSDMSQIKLGDLYKITPVVSMLKPEVLAPYQRRASKNDPSILNQSAIKFTGLFNTELGMDTTNTQNSYIYKIGGLMILLALLGGLAAILVTFYSAKIAAGVAKKMRVDIFKKVESFSNNEFDKFSTASLITRSTNDVMQVQQLLTLGIRMICYAPILGIGGIFMALNKSTSMAWIIAVGVIAMLGVMIVVLSIVMPKFKKMQKLVDKINLVTRETLSGLMVIKAFGNLDFEKSRFMEANKDLTKNTRFVNRVMSTIMPLMMLILNLITLLVIWAGAQQISNSTLNVGDMMAFMQYGIIIITSFIMVAMMFVLIPRAAVSAKRIFEVLDVELTILDPKKPKEFDKSKEGVVEFENVSFKFSGASEEVLKNISFTSMPGETTAIIGPTGSGKSTIINLLLRFYDVTKGSIRVGGRDVREVSQKNLRDAIGYVPQKGVLMSGTIESNIQYGKKNATEDEIKLAANISQATEFIEKNSDGYKALISQGGDNVSGGQKQRLSIARAIIKNPKVYIFDDSFSALDFKTDSILRSALKDSTKDATQIIIGQRVSTIMNADQIIVIVDGEIVGKGTHTYLMENCKEYLEIAESQLTKEELNNE